MKCPHGPLVRYDKLRVGHAPGMPGTFFPPPTSKGTATKRSRHASRHVRHARAVMHVGIASPRWRGKRSWHSRRIRNPQFYVSGKGSIAIDELTLSATSQDLTLFTNTRMHLFHIPQYSIENSNVQIFILIETLWNMEPLYSGICEIALLCTLFALLWAVVISRPILCVSFRFT